MNVCFTKTRFFFLTCIAVFAISPTVFAQFGGLNLNKSSDSAPVDKDSFLKTRDDVTGKVFAARITFLDAKAKLMDALNLKNDSVVKASEALRSKEGATSSTDEKLAALKDSTTTTADADKQFDVALGGSTELSDESKVKFAEGTGKFILGVILEKQQIDTITKLVEQGKSLAASASPFRNLRSSAL